jgi:hypothetical protein
MLAERPMGTVRVVVLDVLGENGFEMAGAEDEHPVEALAPDGADHALADGVGPGARTGLLTILVPSAANTGVEGGGELGVAIADEELDSFRLVGEVNRDVAGLLGTQSAAGLAATPAIRTRQVSWWMNTRT